MQKDKIPADISQIPQEILKSYDRFRFCRYLFFGALLTFLIYIIVFLTFVNDAPIMSFLCMLALSAINILVCLNRLKYKKYALLLLAMQIRPLCLYGYMWLRYFTSFMLWSDFIYR